MDYSYAFLIILLPMLSFIILGLCGMKMSHKVAGLIGTTSLGIVTILSYVTAFGYFTADRCDDGAYATVVPFNFNWMHFGALNFDLGIMLDPISVMMLIVISTHLLVWLHAWREGFPALLRLPVALHNVHARTCCGNKHLPDVSLLGACGC